MFDLIQNIELIQCQGVNFIQCIQARNILSISFNNIDDIIFSSITFNTNISIIDLVLFQNSLNSLVVDSICVDHTWDCNTALIFLFEIDIWWAFVQSNTKAFQLMFDNSFMLHWSGWIEHDNDQIACSTDSNNLLTTTFTILGTFDNTG